jgi:hypothetical protein
MSLELWAREDGAIFTGFHHNPDAHLPAARRLTTAVIENPLIRVPCQTAPAATRLRQSHFMKTLRRY